MNEGGLCGAWEVLMLRPIQSLLLLQPGCMIKCHLSHRPLAPTCRLLSLSHRLSLCYSGSVCCCLCYLVLFFTSLATSSSFFSFPLLCVLSLSNSLTSALHSFFFKSLSLTQSFLVSLPYISSPPLVSPRF